MDEESSTEVDQTADQDVSEIAEIVEAIVDDSRWNIMSGEDPMDCYSPVIHTAPLLQNPDNQMPEQLNNESDPPEVNAEKKIQTWPMIETRANPNMNGHAIHNPAAWGRQSMLAVGLSGIPQHRFPLQPYAQIYHHVHQVAQILPADLRHHVLVIPNAIAQVKAADQAHKIEVSKRLRRLERSMFFDLIASPAWINKTSAELREESTRRLTRSLIRVDQRLSPIIGYVLPHDPNNRIVAKNITAPLSANYRYPIWFLIGRHLMQLKILLTFQNRVSNGPPGTAPQAAEENYRGSVMLAAMNWQFQNMNMWIRDMDQTRLRTIMVSGMRMRIFEDNGIRTACDTLNMTAGPLLNEM